MRWYDYTNMINNRVKSLNITFDMYPRDYSEQGNIYVLRKNGGIIFQCLSKKTLEKKIKQLEEELK